MAKQALSDFLIESNKHCFFCLDRILPNPPLLNGTMPKLATINSLQYLSRFLRMDMRTVFIEKGSVPPHLMAKVINSRLKAHLCSECASLNETFSKLCRHLEKIEIEVLSSLQHIYMKLVNAEEGTGIAPDKFKMQLDSVEESELDCGKLGILEVLRKDAIRKCSIKFKNTRPKIKVHNLTEKDILEQKRKSSSQSDGGKHGSLIAQSGITIKTEVEENIIHDLWPDDQDDDELRDNFEIMTGSPRNLETEELLNVVKREVKEPPQRKLGRQRHPQQILTSDFTINGNVEVVNGTGKCSGQKKFRCRLCRQLFSSKGNAGRHIQCTHLKLKQFRCTQCSKAFSQIPHLQSHMHHHSGFKPYKCHLCSKAFFQKTHLKVHLLAHSGTRPYKCKLCDKAYFQRFELNKHHRLNH